jgi:hypothetical protein
LSAVVKTGVSTNRIARLYANGVVRPSLTFSLAT